MSKTPIELAAEPTRLRALSSYRVLDSVPERTFDDITRIACMICDTPIALISFVDVRRQWFKSRVGMDVSETPVELSFCAHAMTQTDVFVVRDTLRDQRFRENALVTSGPKIRSYAGAPLIDRDGAPLGTVCVIDRVPRILNRDQLYALEALARQTIALLEHRLALIEIDEIYAGLVKPSA